MGDEVEDLAPDPEALARLKRRLAGRPRQLGRDHLSALRGRAPGDALVEVMERLRPLVSA